MAPSSQPQSRWPTLVVMVAVGGVYLSLPDFLRLGPRWLQLTLVVVLLAATVMTYRRGSAGLNRALGHLLAGVITFFLIGSLVLLVLALPNHKDAALAFFHSAVVLWF